MKDVAMPLVDHGTAVIIFGSVAMALAGSIISIVIYLQRIHLFKLIRIHLLCKTLVEVFRSKERLTMENREAASVAALG